MIRNKPVPAESFQKLEKLQSLFMKFEEVDFAYLLLGELNAFLGTDEIDLVVLNSAPISLIGRIMTQKKLLFCRNDLNRHCFESLSFRKFLDFRIFEQRLLSRRFKLG